jgi:hypothetical protein
VTLGGPVMPTPHVIPVFFGDDSLRPAIEGYLKALGKSAYWRATTAEYGVGPLVVDPSVVISEPAPASIDVATGVEWFTREFARAGGAFGTPDRNTIYAIYPPASTIVSFLPDIPNMCNNGLGGGGFHASAVLDAGLEVPFAVSSRCSASLSPGYTDLDVYSASMSHELIEAVTDPLISKPASHSLTMRTQPSSSESGVKYAISAITRRPPSSALRGFQECRNGVGRTLQPLRAMTLASRRSRHLTSTRSPF